MGILVHRDSEQGNKLLGRIDYEMGSNATFQYNEAYLKDARRAGEFGVSERLPLDARPYQSEEIAPFFSGLLPEGEILADLARFYQVPRNDYLALIEQLGCESIGALTFISERVDASEYMASYEPLETTEIDALSTTPIRAAVNVASNTRLSLSGAQSKVAWLLPEHEPMESAALTDWLVPRGTAPSTHIIKIARKGEEEIAINEMACALLAASCGIDTARVAAVTDLPGAIAVERYDRAWVSTEGDHRVIRDHQEDFCQALGLSPFYKYQPEGVETSYLCLIGDLLDATSDNPLLDKREFAKRLVFNYLIGNSDAHLKNSSLLYNRTWTSRRLAPLYDVTCIPLTGYSTKMAFDIGEHRELSDIEERDLMAIPLDLDIPLTLFDAAANEVVSSLSAPKAHERNVEVVHMVDRILDNMQQRMAVVQRYLGI